jgi:uncharacterized short protein YbdD (DUF466 family)
MTLTSIARAVWRYLREVSGESRYERYLERHARDPTRTHAMSRREFERWRTDRRERTPGTRCC